MASGYKSDKKEGGLELIFLGLLVPLIIFGLAWLMGSHKIVAGTIPLCYQLGKMWMLVPGGEEQVKLLVDGGRLFLSDPKAVSFFDWVLYVNISIKPLAVVFAVLMVGLTLPITMMSGRGKLFRKFTPTQLMREMSLVFSGIIPVMHLRVKLVKDQLPLWRRQTFPHEYLMNEKSASGRQLVRDGVIDESALEERLMGLVPGKLIDGRMVSTTLGRQIVNLADDRGKLGKICFPDRMSDVGKVVYALFAAHAFGGSEGVKDYRKAIDELNNSCAGEPNGMANLQVAQWIYTKYRDNEKARQLFSVHHWEYTYLCELLRQAKRQGKCGHTSIMWLKPMNRVLFYAINQVGRWVPHAESSAVFAQHAAEQIASKNGMVLLRRDEKTGRWVHTVLLACAVEGFQLEWHRYTNGSEEEDDWWANDRQWKLLNGLRLDPPPVPSGEAADQVAKASSFDRAQSSEREKADEATRKAESDAAASEFAGVNTGFN